VSQAGCSYCVIRIDLSLIAEFSLLVLKTLTRGCRRGCLSLRHSRSARSSARGAEYPCMMDSFVQNERKYVKGCGRDIALPEDTSICQHPPE
jgi:hypothetical protein